MQVPGCCPTIIHFIGGLWGTDWNNPELERQRVRSIAVKEGELASFRRVYEDLTQKQRSDCKAILRKAAALGQEIDKLPSYGCLSIKIQTIDVVNSDEGGKTIWEGSSAFTPDTLLKAIAAWDKNESFEPGQFTF